MSFCHLTRAPPEIGWSTSDLPQIWNAPATTQADRKELPRTLIEKITVAVPGTSELVDVTITWAGGHQTTGQAVRPVALVDQLSYYRALLAASPNPPKPPIPPGRSPAPSTPKDPARPNGPADSGHTGSGPRSTNTTCASAGDKASPPH